MANNSLQYLSVQYAPEIVSGISIINIDFDLSHYVLYVHIMFRYNFKLKKNNNKNLNYRDFSELKDIGFFSNPRFLNTALTKARCFVTVVGDPYALLSIGPCQDFWKRYLDLADLHEINRTQLQGYDYCKSSSFLPSLNPLAREFIPRSLSSGQYIFNNQALVFQYLPSNRYDNYNNFNNEFYY